MSWSVQIIGRPEAVVAELDRCKMGNEQSQREFEDAKPHLQALVRMNDVKEGSGYFAPVVTLKASGHATWQGSTDGPSERVQSTLSASIETFYGTPAV